MVDFADEVDNATGFTRSGVPKALTKTQREADSFAGTFMPGRKVNSTAVAPDRTPLESTEARRARIKGTIDAANNQPGAGAVFVENVGGIARDVYNAMFSAQANKDVDAAYDKGEYRKQFIKQFGPDYRDAFERTVNKDMYDALVTNITEEQGRMQRAASHPWAALAGQVIDPTVFLSGAGAAKAAMFAASAAKFGKYKTLAVAAGVEGAFAGGVEAGTQNYTYGGVVHADDIRNTFLFTAGATFGISAALARKSTSRIDAQGPNAQAAMPLQGQNANVAPEAAPVQTDAFVSRFGNSEVAEAAAGLQNLARKDAEALGTTAELKPPSVTDPVPLLKPRAEPGAEGESGLAAAGADSNIVREQVGQDALIDTNSENIKYVQEQAVRVAAEARSNVGEGAYKFLDSIPGKIASFNSNFLRGMKSPSDVVQAFMYQVAEDPTGLFRKGTVGTAVDRVRYARMMREGIGEVHQEYDDWLTRSGQRISTGRIVGTAQHEWNTMLRREMEARDMLNGQSADVIAAQDAARWADIPPEIKRAADALDASNKKAVDLMLANGVDGAENLVGRRGYVPRQLDGRKLIDLKNSDPKKFHDFKDAYAWRMFRSIRGAQQELINQGAADLKVISERTAKAIAEGMVDRAIQRSAGVGGNTVGLFDKAGRAEIRAILKGAGLDHGEIEKTFALMDKRLGQTSSSNRMKSRIDIDIVTPDEETGIVFSDFYDNDLNKLMTGYAEEMSGRIALTRVGIRNDNDFENIINAVVSEGKGNAEQLSNDVQLLRDTYAQMLGRRIAGQGDNGILNTLVQLNPVQTLGNQWSAQLSEFSTLVSRLGIGGLIKGVPMLGRIIVGARKGMLSKEDAALLKEIDSWNGPIGMEWKTHRPSTDTMEMLTSHSVVAQQADRMLKSGQRLNGWISGMYQIMEAQLKLTAIRGSQVMAKEIVKGNLTRRLADAGFDDASMKAIAGELKKHGEWKGDTLVKMNADKWSVYNANNFMRNVERLSGQLIQRDYAGESASWMSKDYGRLLLSLRGYSVRAFNKQLVRNVAIRDAVAAQTFLYGLGFSAATYTARAHIMSLGRSDRDEYLEKRLSGNNLIMGIVGYSAMGSIFPELVRPALGWFSDPDEQGAFKPTADIASGLVPGIAPAVRLATSLGDIGEVLGSQVAGDGSKEWDAARTRRLVGNLSNNWMLAIPLNYAVEDGQ